MKKVIYLTLLISVAAIVVLAIYFLNASNFIFYPIQEINVISRRIDFNNIVQNVELENYFEPLYSNTDNLVSSLINIGGQESRIDYLGFFKVNNIDYAYIESENQKKQVKSGDQISLRNNDGTITNYLIFGITEQIILLNDLNSDKFLIVKKKIK